MSVYAKEYQTGDVLKAAGINNAALQNYLRRNLIVGHKDIKGGGGSGTGNRRLYTFSNLMEVAMAKALMDAGMKGSAKDAFLAAQRFSHSGKSATDRTPERKPGLPFYPCHGLTIFGVSQERAAIIPATPDTDSLSLIRSELNDPTGFVVVVADDVFARVCGALRRLPSDVFAEEYGEEPR